MMRWIRSNPLYAGAAALVLMVVLLAIVAGAFRYFQNRAEKHDEQLIDLGASEERGAANEKVLNDVQEAHDAVIDPSSNDLNVVCSKYDRNCPNGK